MCMSACPSLRVTVGGTYRVFHGGMLSPLDASRVSTGNGVLLLLVPATKERGIFA